MVSAIKSIRCSDAQIIDLWQSNFSGRFGGTRSDGVYASIALIPGCVGEPRSFPKLSYRVSRPSFFNHRRKLLVAARLRVSWL